MNLRRFELDEALRSRSVTFQKSRPSIQCLSLSLCLHIRLFALSLIVHVASSFQVHVSIGTMGTIGLLLGRRAAPWTGCQRPCFDNSINRQWQNTFWLLHMSAPSSPRFASLNPPVHSSPYPSDAHSPAQPLCLPQPSCPSTSPSRP